MNNTCLLAFLRFDGKRFENHALDVDCVGELQAYKKLILECAKVIWARNHSDRERLPKGFEDRLVLRFDTLLEGSAVVPLQRVKQETQLGLDLGELDEFDQAANLVDAAIQAANNDELLPNEFPRNVIPLFRDFGKSLSDDEVLYLRARERNSESPYNAAARKRLSEWTESTYEDYVDVTGAVSMANVRGGGFELQVAAGQPQVKGRFTPEQENEVLDALRSHKTSRLRVVGVGEFSQSDKVLRRFVKVDSVSLAVIEEVYADVKPIWEIVADLGISVPDDVWLQVPDDLAQNLDQYLYSGKEKK